jgi:dTDP-4-amino-4,6-dideoxygalactose transaminase
MQPLFANSKAFVDGTSQRLFESGLCLPSGSSMSDEDVVMVSDKIKEVLK